jgi:hypothetical protein
MDKLAYQILQLVRICKRHQRKAMARDAVLGALVDDAPDVRAALTQNRTTEMLNQEDDAACRIVDHEFAELEAALLDGTDFLPALERFLEKNI